MVLGGVARFFPIGLYVDHALLEVPMATTDMQLSSNIIVGAYVILFGLGTSIAAYLMRKCVNANNHRNSYRPSRFVLHIVFVENPYPNLQLQNSRSHLKSAAMRPSCSPLSDEESVRDWPNFNTPGRRCLRTVTVYIFIGSIIVSDNVWSKIAGSVVGFIGIAYAALEFIPSIEPPANMRYVCTFPEETLQGRSEG